MAVREILIEGHPTLRLKARRVRRVDRKVRELIADMFETVRAASGLGLAAPQIGVSERVIVIEVPEDMEDEPHAGTVLALVNPEIVKTRGEEIREEACLSIPGFFGEVKRAAQVTVKGLDPEGKEVRMKAGSMLARALQHEIDHLDGVLFIDRAEEGTVHYVSDEVEDEIATVTDGE